MRVSEIRVNQGLGVDTFKYFLEIWVYFQAYKHFYPPKKNLKLEKKMKIKRSFGFRSENHQVKTTPLISSGAKDQPVLQCKCHM